MLPAHRHPGGVPRLQAHPKNGCRPHVAGHQGPGLRLRRTRLAALPRARPTEPRPARPASPRTRSPATDSLHPPAIRLQDLDLGIVAWGHQLPALPELACGRVDPVDVLAVHTARESLLVAHQGARTAQDLDLFLADATKSAGHLDPISVAVVPVVSAIHR